jgi:hypothetical protein
MTHVEEEKVTTTYQEADPPKPHVDNINLNVNSTNGETVTVDDNPQTSETRETRTTTTRSEVHESD